MIVKPKLFLDGDCVPTCIKCFKTAYEGCKCKDPHWSMDHSKIQELQKVFKGHIDPNPFRYTKLKEIK